MRLRESVARENRTPRLSGGRWPALRRLGAPPPTRRMPVYEILEERGLEEVHSVGLLHASFRPAGEIVVLRSYVRHRQTLVEASATCIHRMQKALSQMNLN